MDQLEFLKRTRRFLTAKEPFFFLVNFDKTKCFALSFDEARHEDIIFEINGVTNGHKSNNVLTNNPLSITVEPFPFESYLEGFELVMDNLKLGNSFLTNLTFPSKITSKLDLKTVFSCAKAHYKLRFKNKFVCFSPECFVRIKDDYIHSYPMKGTIDASIPNAAKVLLENDKEKQEHYTIVDLIRNDISMVAREVNVTKFRYIEEIPNANGNILQTSSEIRGKLDSSWKKDFGGLLLNMLPAGSISGAPKPQTLSIIKEAERYDRNFYTGVFGVFDGNGIDSGVAIRFIEQNADGLWYKSGGGITHQSNVKEEYVELIKKIYIPTF